MKNKHINIGEEYADKPCIYINSKPAFIGNVIKLKAYNEISGAYDMALENLISENHRFVIIHHFGINRQTIAVCLLSTSAYLNETKELGIKLKGNYNKYKDVYMDATRCWVIPSSCAKSIEYDLTESDKFRCIFNWVNNYAGTMKVYKGVADNENVNNQFEDYTFWFSASKFNEARNRLKATTIARYIKSMSDAEIHIYIASQPKELVNEEMGYEMQRRESINKPVKVKQTLAVLKEPSFYIAPDREFLEAVMCRLIFRNNDLDSVAKFATRLY